MAVCFVVILLCLCMASRPSQVYPIPEITDEMMQELDLADGHTEEWTELNCGEQYFEARVLKGIEKKFNELHVHGSKASKAVQVPVEHFLDLHQV